MMSSTKQRGSMERRGKTSAATDVFMNENELPEQLDDVLADKNMRTEFMVFLRGRLANETLLFYESIEMYEQLTTPEHRSKAGRKMVEEFVMPEAIYWVNLSAVLREELTSCLEFLPETFSNVKAEVFQLMNSNFFMSFRKHLAGRSDADAAPDLTFSSNDSARAESFAHLASALGGSFYMTGENAESVNCNCPRTENWQDVCCDAKKAKLRILAMRGYYNRSSVVSRSGPTRKTQTDQPSTTRRAMKAIGSMFTKKKHMAARHMSLWQSVDDDNSSSQP